MILFFFKPIQPDQLQIYYIVEVVLIIMNFFLFISALIFLSKIRIHINLKVISIGIVSQYLPCLTARLIIIGYETGVLYLGSWFSKVLNSVQNNSRMFSSLYVLGIDAMTSDLFYQSVEREFSMQFILDYEKHKRLWIAALILISDIFFCALFASAYTFEWMPWYPIAIFGVIATIFGILLMKNAIISLGLINISTFAVFLAANSATIRDKYGEALTQLFDCIYNILIVIYGPILALGGTFHNNYLIGVIKSLFPFIFVMEKEEEEHEPGHIYFVQLQELWEKPVSKKEEKYRQKRNILSSRFARIQAF